MTPSKSNPETISIVTETVRAKVVFWNALRRLEDHLTADAEGHDLDGIDDIIGSLATDCLEPSDYHPTNQEMEYLLNWVEEQRRL